MKNVTTFSVMPLGMKPTEVSVLKALFSITARRTWLYRLLESDDNSAKVDVWLVDRGNPQADNYYRDNITSANPSAVCINICSEDDQMQEDTLCNFRRPLRMQHLIKALDVVVVKRLNYVPPISDDMEFDKKLMSGADTDASESNGMAGYSALVVDDSPTVRAMMNSILSGMAMEVTSAEGSVEAMKMLNLKDFDIIFLDVVLPGSIDGYKLCKIFKSSGRARHTPVIMLTSKDTTLDKVRGKLAGAEAYLTKPVNQAELIMAINKVLKKSIMQNLKNNTQLAT